MSRRIARSCLVALVAALVTPGFAQQGWRPYQFKANERLHYKLKWTQGGKTSTGHYKITVRDAGEGRLKVEVDGKLGDTECNAAVTVDSPEAVPQQMMMNCMMIAPAMMVFYGPTAGYYTGKELNDDDEWSYTHGGESMSFRVEGDCRHAGQTGKLAVMRHNDEVRMKSCVSMKVPLALAVTVREEGGDSIEATLVEYRN